MPAQRSSELQTQTLSSIKEAHKQGRSLTDSETMTILSRDHLLTVPALPRNLRINVGKKGEVRYWLADQPKGPGRTEHPLLERLWSMEQAFIDSCSPMDHRRQKAQQKATAAAAVACAGGGKALAILEALSQAAANDRHSCARIAKRFDVLPSYVRKLRSKRAYP